MSYKPKFEPHDGRKNTSVNELIKFNEEKINKIFAFPSQITDAKIHQIASTFGYKSISKDNQAQICPCCSESINTQELPLNLQTTPNLKEDHPKQQFKLATGISLFFTFIKMAILYLILRLLLTDMFNIISSTASGTFCSNNPTLCTPLFITESSAYNKIDQQYLVYTLDILNLITVVVSIFYFNFYRKIQYKIQNLINCTQHTQDDYSLFVENIPIILIDQNEDIRNLQFNYESKLKKFFQEKLAKWLQNDIKNGDSANAPRIEKQFMETIKGFNPTQTKKVSGITLCYNLTEMQILKKMRENLMSKYSVLAKQVEQESNSLVEGECSFKKEKMGLQIKLMNEQIIILSKKMAEDNSMSFNLTHFVGKAFVSFEYQHFRDYILREYQNNKSFLTMTDTQKHMKVSLSSIPKEVIWEHMKVTDSQRLRKIITSYLILLMVLTFAFGGVMGINRQKGSIHKNNPDGDTINLLLTILMTVVILVINTGLVTLVNKLTMYQKHLNQSQYLLSKILKTVITQFFNTSIIYYISQLIYPSPMLEEQGLVFQVSSLFLTSAVIQIVMNLAYISSLVKHAKNFLFYRNKTELQMFQIQLNSELQYAQFEIADRYAYYILQIFTAAFYSYLTPIATLSLIFAFIVQYWIDKFNLFKRSSCKYNMDFQMSRNIFKIFQSSLLIFTIGNLIFSIYLHKHQANKVNKVNIAALIIAFAYFCLIWFAPNHLFIKLFASYEEIETTSYSECVKNKYFKQTYWKTNPGTMYVKEIDINTKEEVRLDNIGAFANAENLKEAEQNWKNYVEEVEQDIVFQGLNIVVKQQKQSVKSQSVKEVKA